MTKQELPKWFNGELYEKGDVVRNRFSGESYELTAEELSMYDFIMGANQLMEMGMYAPKTVDDMRKGITWFQKYFPKQYMVLLD